MKKLDFLKINTIGSWTNKLFRERIFWVSVALLALGIPNISSATEVAISCTPTTVAVFFGSRIHVQCSAGYGNILYFALPASTSTEMQQANELQSLGMAAIATGKQITLIFDDADTSGASFGCGTNDCRKLRGAIMVK